MRKNKITIQVKEATKLRCTVFFRFFFRCQHEIRRVEFHHESAIEKRFKISWTEGERGNFELQCLLKEDEFPWGATIAIITDLATVNFNLDDLMAEEAQRYQNEPKEVFLKQIDTREGQKMLDIGGRDRSKVDHSKRYPTCDVTVFDILPSGNVDVVGDAHELSAHFEENTFDLVFSIAVFEHLLMPWKVVLEINKILKTGGVGFVATHQSLGLHDMPWDFWRYSDTAWDALFNHHTGFEILSRELGVPNYIIPVLYRDVTKGSDRAKGFQVSSVTFRKIGESKLRWDVPLNDLTETMYPE